jgi:hypothetical protein
MSVMLSSATTPDFGRSCVPRGIEPLTLNRAAPKESKGGPINYSDAR